MNKLITWLSIALAIQLMIAGGLWAAQRQSGAENSAQPLLAFERDSMDGHSFERDSIDRIVISAGESSVAMTKTENQWQLDGQHNLPAAENKLEGVLDQIATVKAGWPVARTESSRKRLEVANDKYQKRLQLYSGDELISDLYVGTSPGFRKVHVRRAGEDEVYSVMLNSYDLTVKTDDWLDKDLLKLEGVDQIEGADFNLKNVGDNWSFVNVEDPETPGSDKEELGKEELDEGKAKELASAISNLRVQGVADQTLGEAAVEMVVSNSDGEVKFRFAENDSNYYVTRNDVDAVFTLSKFDYERIVKFNRNMLAKQQTGGEGETEKNS